MTTVEHAIPIPTLYDDVLTLYALSGTGSTPTHIVNYGGVMGEQLVWAYRDVPNDPKFVNLVISIIPATHHIYLCLGYDALLDMISWRPCRSLLRDRSTVRLSPKILLTLADHHTIYKAYALFNTSRSVAAMVHKGLLANIGAHGEPPLGLNYHAEMVFTAKGGLSNYEVNFIWFIDFIFLLNLFL